MLKEDFLASFSACRMVALMKEHDLAVFLVQALRDIRCNRNAQCPVISGGVLENAGGNQLSSIFFCFLHYVCDDLYSLK